MKWLVSLLVVMVAGAGYLYLPPDLYRTLVRGTPLEREKAAILYQWRDARGLLQVTDHPPPDGVSYRRLELEGDVTVLPRVSRE